MSRISETFGKHLVLVDDDLDRGEGRKEGRLTCPHKKRNGYYVLNFSTLNSKLFQWSTQLQQTKPNMGVICSFLLAKIRVVILAGVDHDIVFNLLL